MYIGEDQIPLGNLEGDVAFFVFGGVGGEGAIDGHLANRQQVAFVGDHERRDVLDEVGRVVSATGKFRPGAVGGNEPGWVGVLDSKGSYHGTHPEGFHDALAGSDRHRRIAVEGLEGDSEFPGPGAVVHAHDANSDAGSASFGWD